MMIESNKTITHQRKKVDGTLELGRIKGVVEANFALPGNSRNSACTRHQQGSLIQRMTAAHVKLATYSATCSSNDKIDSIHQVMISSAGEISAKCLGFTINRNETAQAGNWSK
jgi:phage baseplate assembly protein gpV